MSLVCSIYVPCFSSTLMTLYCIQLWGRQLFRNLSMSWQRGITITQSASELAWIPGRWPEPACISACCSYCWIEWNYVDAFSRPWYRFRADDLFVWILFREESLSLRKTMTCTQRFSLQYVMCGPTWKPSWSLVTDNSIYSDLALTLTACQRTATLPIPCNKWLSPASRRT